MDTQSLKNITKLLSVIGIFLSLFFLIPILVGFFENEDVSHFIYGDILFFLFNLFLFLILRNYEINFSLRDGILSVNIIWLFVGFAGGIPLWIDSDITLMQGIFESISGFTTTGATIYKDIEALPDHILIL